MAGTAGSAGEAAGTITSVVPGTGAASLGKAESGTPEDGDTGVMLLAVRQDSLSALAADGKYIPVVVDASGRLYIAPAPTNAGVDIGDIGIKASQTVGLDAGAAAIGKLAANSGVDIGDVDVTSLPALATGSNVIGRLAANSGVDIGDVTLNGYLSAIIEQGVTELIDADDAAMVTSTYSDSKTLTLAGTYSGEITNILLTMDIGSGVVITEDATLYFFDADPAISAADTAITIAERKTIVAQVDVAEADWQEDGSGASVMLQVSQHFHSLAALYVVYFHRGATTINSAGGDDEEIHMNMWYRRDS